LGEKVTGLRDFWMTSSGLEKQLQELVRCFFS